MLFHFFLSSRFSTLNIIVVDFRLHHRRSPCSRFFFSIIDRVHIVFVQISIFFGYSGCCCLVAWLTVSCYVSHVFAGKIFNESEYPWRLICNTRRFVVGVLRHFRCDLVATIEITYKIWTSIQCRSSWMMSWDTLVSQRIEGKLYSWAVTISAGDRILSS